MKCLVQRFNFTNRTVRCETPHFMSIPVEKINKHENIFFIDADILATHPSYTHKKRTYLLAGKKDGDVEPAQAV